jgi:hypothetical protein
MILLEQEINNHKGAGKSVLTTYLVDKLCGRKEFLTLYFFFRDGDSLTMSPSEMVASLIAQLIGAEQDKQRLMRILKLRMQFSSCFTNQANELRNFDTLCTTFLEMVQGFPRPVIVLLDALDECVDPSSIIHHLLGPASKPESITSEMLLPTLKSNIPIRFVLTGRPNVHDIFAPLPYVTTINMDASEDIRKFVKEKVVDNESLHQHEDHIIATIAENSQGMFRYAGEHKYKLKLQLKSTQSIISARARRVR